MKPTFFIVGHYPNDKLFSMELFDQLIEKQLRSKGYHVVVWKPPVILGKIVESPNGLGKWLGYFDKLILFKLVLFVRRLSMEKASLVVFTDHSHGIYVPIFKNHPHVIHVHDLIAIRTWKGEFHTSKLGRFGQLYQSWIFKGLMKGSRFICISNATKDDLLRVSDNAIAKESATVVLNELNREYKRQDSATSKLHLEAVTSVFGSPFFLHVGNATWYKNRKGAILLYSEWLKANPKNEELLVIVGPEHPPDVNQLIKRLGLENRIVNLGSIEYETLEALYSSAKAFIFPSLHEGFGWPIIEAFACGCPVVTTNKAPMSEIAASLAQLVEEMPQDSSEDALESWLQEGATKIDEAIRSNSEDNRQKRINYAKRFRPGTAFPNYLEIYLNELASNRHA
jgi:glycosyltransferase involved in cell wall biosynthesis